MALKIHKPTTPGRRHRKDVDMSVLSKKGPEKSLLLKGVYKRQGRNNDGIITVRHRGGGNKRHMRAIDFRRDKQDVPGIVVSIEYDPMRSARIALISYKDGEKRYILAPEGLVVGREIMSGKEADIAVGNSMPLSRIPVGTPIHNIEITAGKGGQLIRSAGAAALIQSKEGAFVTIALPSKEVRLIKADCVATIGQVGNVEWKTSSIGKAGRKRHMGWRPTVRGTAQHPASHPHGGGEGRSGVGLKYPKTPWGKHALGTKTRSRKRYSKRMIVKDRRVK
jgi:large subunit ribosomal protein L2